MDLSDRGDLVWLSGLIRDLRRAMSHSTPLLVGATARGLQLHHGHGIPIARATTDVDVAFAMADWEEFDTLRAALIDSHAFVPTRSDHRLLHQHRVPVDLIPFGEIEAPNGTITWPAEEAEMGVLGFREALATSIELILLEMQTVLTPSLSMLAVLKLIAWSERHLAEPRKDAGDLFLILRNYLNQENSNRLYAEAAHLLEVDDFDHEAAGGWLGWPRRRKPDMCLQLRLGDAAWRVRDRAFRTSSTDWIPATRCRNRRRRDGRASPSPGFSRWNTRGTISPERFPLIFNDSTRALEVIGRLGGE